MGIWWETVVKIVWVTSAIRKMIDTLVAVVEKIVPQRHAWSMKVVALVLPLAIRSTFLESSNDET